MLPSESGAATSADDVVREQKQERPIVKEDVPIEPEAEPTESSKEPEEDSQERPKRRKGL